ncbi:MAG: hypothetical protein ACE3L7_31105 [Candidatus Pristimantibacillus sp.]
MKIKRKSKKLKSNISQHGKVMNDSFNELELLDSNKNQISPFHKLIGDISTMLSKQK